MLCLHHKKNSTVGFNVICCSFVSCHKIRMYIVLFTEFPFYLSLFLHSKGFWLPVLVGTKLVCKLVNIWANKDESVI